MNARILLWGLLGGLLVTAALLPPLYLVLPTHYDRTWSIVPPAVGNAGIVIALLLGVGTGYAAARWSWTTPASAGAQAGALAGWIAAMVAYPLIVAPAADVASQGPAFLYGAEPGVTMHQTIRIVVECVIRSSWYPYLAFWGMFVVGPVLGGLGGWFAGRQQSPHWGRRPPAVPDEGCDASISILVCCSLILVVCLSAITSLRSNCQKSVDTYNLTPSWPVWGVLGSPVVTCLLIMMLAIWFCGRWCARRWEHPVAGVRLIARLGAIVMIGLPILSMGWAARVHPDIYSDGGYLLAMGACLGVAIYWLLRIRFRPQLDSSADALPSPTLRDRLIVNGGLLGTLIPALSMATGVTQALALALGIVVYIPILFSPYLPMVGASTVGVAASSPETGPLAALIVMASNENYLKLTPSDVPPSATSQIQELYATHFWGAPAMAAFWIMLALLHALAVWRWQAYLRQRKAREALGTT